MKTAVVVILIGAFLFLSGYAAHESGCFDNLGDLNVPAWCYALRTP